MQDFTGFCWVKAAKYETISGSRLKLVIRGCEGLYEVRYHGASEG